MSDLEDEWPLTYRARPVFGETDSPVVMYAWDGGRYVFLFWFEDWEAMNYFASIEDMPERCQQIVSEAISQFENWDVWDNEKSAPAFEPNQASFEAYVNRRIEEKR